MESKLNILLLEENEHIRNVFNVLLQNSRKFKVVACCKNIPSALRALQKYSVDIALLSFSRQDRPDTEGVKRLKRFYPSIPILLVGQAKKHADLIDAFGNGAIGFISPERALQSLSTALEEVYHGGAPMSKNFARMLIETFRRNYESPLTPRETEVLERMAVGKTFRNIAGELSICRETVKSHVKNIYHKLQVHTKAEAIEIAHTQRFI